MNARKISCVEDKAEGTCAGVPFNTELVNIDGVNVHFWIGGIDPVNVPTRLAEAINVARDTRDVVSITYSDGEPTGHWAHEVYPLEAPDRAIRAPSTRIGEA